MKSWALTLTLSAILVAGCGTFDDGISAQRQSGDAAPNTDDNIGQAQPPSTKSPYLEQLQAFYAQGAKLRDRLWSSDVTDDQIDDVAGESNDWFSATSDWVRTHMTAAEAGKFARRRVSYGASDLELRGNHRSGYARVRSNAMNLLNERLNGLEQLMNSLQTHPQANVDKPVWTKVPWPKWAEWPWS